MIKNRPILSMDYKEFMMTMWTWSSLQYRNRWLQDNVKKLWLQISFRNKGKKM